jgi:error-prone DNA polymerase
VHTVSQRPCPPQPPPPPQPPRHPEQPATGAGRVLPAYAELLCRSNYSFLSGASHPEELVQRAHALGYAALAVADECSVSGVVRAHTEAVRVGLQLIVGVQMQLAAPEGAGKPVKAGAAGKTAPGAVQPGVGAGTGVGVGAGPGAVRGTPSGDGARLVLLVQSRRGYANLVHWVTLARRRAPKGEYRALPSDIEGRAPTAPMLAGLPGCLALLVPQAGQAFETVFAQAMWLKTWFGTDRARLALCLQLTPHDAALADTVRRVAGLKIGRAHV